MSEEEVEVPKEGMDAGKEDEAVEEEVRANAQER